jgi:molecular chaperone DnaK
VERKVRKAIFQLGGEIMVSPFKAGNTVGIDLGTTRSAVAYMDEFGKACVIPNSGAELITPSVVLIDEGDTILVGTEAKNQSVAAGSRVIRESKREIGRSDASGKIDGNTYTPEMIGAMVLKKLKADAEIKLGPIVNAVITVPAYFDDSQRAATEAAGQLAGLNVVGIFNEPVAAALAYGLDKKREDGHVVVYDLGGGTFDVSVMKLEAGKIIMVATDGNVELGGKDWDERIIQRVAEKFREEHGVDPLDDVDVYQQLKNDCEAAKESLTNKEKTRIILQCSGHKLVHELTRAEFDEMTADLLSQTENTLAAVVEDQAGLTWDQVSQVLLVGGSSKMPQVAKMVASLTSKKVSVGDPQPDLCVALGAAYYGAVIQTQQALDPSSGMAPEVCQQVQDHLASLPPAQQQALTDTQVTMVTSHAYGVGVYDDQRQEFNAIMIKKNAALPSQYEQTFGLMDDNQDSVVFPVYEGEERDPKFCTKAGEVKLDGFPPSPAGTPVEVCMEFSREGVILIHCTCRGRDGKATIKRPQGMSAAEMASAGRLLAMLKVE